MALREVYEFHDLYFVVASSREILVVEQEDDRRCGYYQPAQRTTKADHSAMNKISTKLTVGNCKLIVNLIVIAGIWYGVCSGVAIDKTNPTDRCIWR